VAVGRPFTVAAAIHNVRVQPASGLELHTMPMFAARRMKVAAAVAGTGALLFLAGPRARSPT
jgi:hypothetical protein